MYDDEASRIRSIAALDPSFRMVARDILRNAEARLRAAPSADGFRLEALRLMALGGNGHSRAIANRAAQVAPIRFIWLAEGPCVAEGPHLGARLVAINGVGIAKLFREMRPLLAGTEQRARVLAASCSPGLRPSQWRLEGRGPRTSGCRRSLENASSLMAEMPSRQSVFTPFGRSGRLGR